jgi:hypothetical protein
MREFTTAGVPRLVDSVRARHYPGWPMAHQVCYAEGRPSRLRATLASCLRRLQVWAPLGLGLGDRFGGFRGRSGSFKERMREAEKRADLQGKRFTKRVSQMRQLRGGTSMVRRGSTVRVRQRASLFSRIVPGRSLELSCYSPAWAGVGRTCPHYARVERNAFTLVVRGSFISRL